MAISIKLYSKGKRISTNLDFSMRVKDEVKLYDCIFWSDKCVEKECYLESEGSPTCFKFKNPRTPQGVPFIATEILAKSGESATFFISCAVSILLIGDREIRWGHTWRQ